MLWGLCIHIILAIGLSTREVSVSRSRCAVLSSLLILLFTSQSFAGEPVKIGGKLDSGHTAWMVYQLMFAIITPGLICGAYAERMKFSAMLLFSMLWLLLIYCPLAHMVWGNGGLFNWGLPGSPNIPTLDFAGGTVVHISS